MLYLPNLFSLRHQVRILARWLDVSDGKEHVNFKLFHEVNKAIIILQVNEKVDKTGLCGKVFQTLSLQITPPLHQTARFT